MPRQWPPWWIWALGAPLAFTAGLTVLAHLSGPIGWSVERDTHASGRPVFRVLQARRGTPAADAGLRADDLLRAHDLDAFLASAGPGREFQFEIERAGEPRTIVLRWPRKDLAHFASVRGMKELLAIAASALCLLLAGVIVFERPLDRVARWGALFLAQLGVMAGFMFFYVPLPPELASLIRRLPLVAGPVTLIGFSISTLFPATALTFVGTFPRTAPSGGRLALIWLPGLVTIPLSLRMYWLPVYYAEPASVVPRWAVAIAIVTGVIYLIISAALLMRNYLRLTTPNDRRRTQVLVFGLAVTTVGLLAMVLLTLPWRPVEAIRAEYWEYMSVLLPLTIAMAPICTAYAILRHRMFDISIMVRLGLQYAAARGLLASLVPLVGLALVVDLLAHGDQPLIETVRERGWLYGGVGLAAYLLHVKRAKWLAALDRRFFRERYDAQRILHGVVEEVRRSSRFDEAAPRVIAEIDSALHPEIAALTLRGPGAAAHRVVASRGTPPPALMSGSTLMALVRVLGKPVEIPPDESSWILRQLPPEESGVLRQSRIEWIFPIALAPQPAEALLVLGRKRSEEPYSNEDQGLLQGVVTSLALVLERSAAVTPSPDSFAECPECGVCYDPGALRCARDGAHLTPSPFRRTISGRYRLDCHLGRGGMGTVYKGFDAELARQVAVKLIRPELLSGEDAMARFRQEAKAAAGFSHPNVVTVHDFGVADDGRAYLVMELLEGSTLRDTVARHGPLPPARALRVLRDVCAGVTAAHRLGLLHRDLKPENLFLTSVSGQDTAKVLDFGVAKHLYGATETQPAGSETTPGVLVGTLRYMSPEQLRGEAPSASWDVWALAVVAFEMLTGRYPFRAAPDPVLGIGFEPDLQAAPTDCGPFFARALACDRERRPPSAAALFQDLQATLEPHVGGLLT